MSGLDTLYVEAALARHEEFVRDAMARRLVSEALATGKENMGLRNRLMLKLGQWLVASGKRLQMRHRPSGA